MKLQPPQFGVAFGFEEPRQSDLPHGEGDEWKQERDRSQFGRCPKRWRCSGCGGTLDGSSQGRLLGDERLEFFFVPDGREMQIAVNGDKAAFKPATGVTPASVTAIRMGAELKLALRNSLGDVQEEKAMPLAGAKLEPAPISFSVPGPAEKDGLRLTSVLVNGPVRPTE